MTTVDQQCARVYAICVLARRVSLRPIPQWVSQVTCGDQVKWITDKKSRKDRSVSKGETMSIEKIAI